MMDSNYSFYRRSEDQLVPEERVSKDITTELGKLRTKVDRLSLSCQALWELVREHSDISEDDLINKIIEVDLRDGSRDGRIRSSAIECGNCSRNTSPNRDTCFWCGAPVDRPHLFE